MEGSHTSKEVLGEAFCIVNYDWIGFDLDHTIIRYHIDVLTDHIYKCATHFMIDSLGYDSRVFEKYPHQHGLLVRGVIVDKYLGNYLHIDANRRVKVAPAFLWLSSFPVRMHRTDSLTNLMKTR